MSSDPVTDAQATMDAQSKWGLNASGQALVRLLVAVRALQTRGVAARSDIAALDSRVTALESRVTALETRLPPAP